MEEKNKILEAYTEKEKTAYLGAIMSIATADRQASEEEIAGMEALTEAAGLSEPQKRTVVGGATETSGKELIRFLDGLKNSELRFSLIADLMLFAKADDVYEEEEEENVHKIAEYLGVNEHQLALLDQFADKARTKEVPVRQDDYSNFLQDLAMKDKLQNEGINGSGLLGSLLGVTAPDMLSNMFSNPSAEQGTMGGMNRGGWVSAVAAFCRGRNFVSTAHMLNRVLGRGGHL